MANIQRLLAHFKLDPEGYVQASEVQAIFPQMDSIAVGKFLKSHWGTAIRRTSKRFPGERDNVKRVYVGITKREDAPHEPLVAVPPEPTPVHKTEPTPEPTPVHKTEPTPEPIVIPEPVVVPSKPAIIYMMAPKTVMKNGKFF